MKIMGVAITPFSNKTKFEKEIALSLRFWQ